MRFDSTDVIEAVLSLLAGMTIGIFGAYYLSSNPTPPPAPAPAAKS